MRVGGGGGWVPEDDQHSFEGIRNHKNKKIKIYEFERPSTTT